MPTRTERSHAPELKAILDKWSAEWEAGQAAQGGGTRPGTTCHGPERGASAPASTAGSGARGPQNQSAERADVDAMMAALPAQGRRRVRSSRVKVLVLGKAARLRALVDPARAPAPIEALGQKTGAWSTTVTYDPADDQRAESAAVRRDLPGRARRANSSTTRTIAAATAARRKALLDFVRGGKGTGGYPRRDRFVSSERAGAGRGPARPRDTAGARRTCAGWWRRSPRCA